MMLFVILTLGILPYIVGMSFNFDIKPWRTYLYGFLSMEALFSIVYLVFIFFSRSFWILSMLYSVSLMPFVVLGVINLFRRREDIIVSFRKTIKEIGDFFFFNLVTVGVILFQVSRLLFLQPWQYRDYKTYTAIINDVLSTGLIYGTDPFSGNYNNSIASIGPKFAFTPWYIFEAWICNACSIKPIVLVETIIPAVVLLLSYISMGVIAEFFWNSDSKRKIIMIMLSPILFECLQPLQDQAGIMLIWSGWGKNIPASITLPLLYVTFCRTMEKECKYNGILMLLILSIVSCSTTAASMMCIPLMVLALVVSYCIQKKSLNALTIGAVVAMPAIIELGLYVLLMSARIRFPTGMR